MILQKIVHAQFKKKLFISFVNILSIKIAGYLALTEIFHGPFGFQQTFSRK